MSLSDTRFSMTRDINGYNGFGLPASTINQSMVLAATVEQHITVPESQGYWIAVLSYTPGVNIWVDNIGTSVVPTGAASATTAMLNPAGLYVKGGSELSFITSDVTSPQVSVRYYVAPPYTN